MGSAGSPGQPPPGCARGVGEGWGASQASLGLAPCLSSQLVVSWGEGCSQAAQVPVTCAHAHSHSHTLTLTYAGSRMQAHTCTNFAAPQLPGSSSQMAPEPRRDVTDTQGAPMGPRSASLPLALPSLPVPGVGGLQCGRPGFEPWVRKIPCRRKWQPILVFLPGEFHGQRSLAGYSPRSHRELITA